MDMVQKASHQKPVFLDESDVEILTKAKHILKTSLQNTPNILELCKRVGMNKNKLQEGFRITEGKSIAEYTRTLRMEQTLELLENSDLSMQEIAQMVGYHGVSNFYAVFNRTFGESPAVIQKMLKDKEN